MSDNAVSGIYTFAADDVSSALWPYAKMAFGADGTATIVTASVGLPVGDAGGSLTVDAPVATPVFVRLSDGASAISTLPVSLASVPALAAGSAVIGAVTQSGTWNVATVTTVTTVGAVTAISNALPAGTNNIGDVDVLTLPALAAGSNVIGAVTQSGTWTVTGAGGSFPVTDSSGSLTVDAPVGTPVFVRLSDGSSAIATLPVSVASVPSHAVTNAGTFAVQPTPATSGGLTMSKTVSTGDTTATSVKGSAGQVYGIQVFNINASPRYLKFYNKATAPSVGSDTPVKVILIPGNTAGGGTVMQWPSGLAFSTGIAFGLCTGLADNSSTGVAAADIVVNIDYA